ncbi:TIGR03503 family protein [Rheinheimera riviphila]|uniref:TIGR03503 family protein n=1 Tax=Rheinheimera riviphila TaxID=1834037 RepID=UPI0013E2DB3B|nr:TIGR03503 family protein [Rheinheimera riviphila]
MAKLITALLLCCVAAVSAQTTNPQESATTTVANPTTTAADHNAPTTGSSQGLTELPDLSASNQIPLLDNRFRIDYEVDEITLVFFRKKGTPSVVLVKPDGSKVYSRTATEHQMEWHDDKTYDLIRIKQPTPGPWQAIGTILPESRIMVLTDIDLKVDPLPTDMMVGETLKVTARLTNGGKPINAKDFRDVLKLEVLLISTQKAEYDNNSQTVLEFTSFQDDGKNFDERPRDAIFTGEFKLDFPAGEWIPKYIVKTPLYTRELMQAPILVQRTPLAYKVAEAADDAGRHQLTYTIKDGPADGNTVAFQGRIHFPNSEVQSFTVGEMPGNSRTLAIANTGAGTYRVDNMMFGRTKGGREFVMSLPEYTFEVVGPKVEVPDPAATAKEPAVAAKDVPPAAAATKAPISEPAVAPEKPFPVGWVIAANVLILLLGGGSVLWMMNDKARQMISMLLAKLNPAALIKRKKSGGAADATVGAVSSSQAAATETPAKKAQKNNGGDDILDLSLPDD